MKKIIIPLAVAAAMSLTGCEKKVIDEPIIPDDQKTAIEFSVSEGASTKAGFPGGSTGSAQTAILMHIVSTDNTNTRFTRTVAFADADATQSNTSTSSVSFSGDNIRYWDDAFGRQAKLSVYAVAVPTYNTVTGDAAVLPETTMTAVSSGKWEQTSSVNNKAAWSVGTDQSDKTSAIDKKDLTYSNNISASGLGGRYTYNFSTSLYNTTPTDGRLEFQLKDGGITDGPGKFNKGHLQFKHALSRLTISIAKGTGFSEDINFDASSQVTLKGMPVSGTLDVSTGSWDTLVPGNYADLTKLAVTSGGTTAVGTYLAQVVPGYTFSQNNTTNVIVLSINNNTYYVTSDQIWKALNDKANDGENPNGLSTSATSYTMEAGKNYTLTVTVSKTKIETVTASLVPWNDIEGDEIESDNSHISITTKSATSTECTSFDLYRLLDEQASISLTDNGGTNYVTGYLGTNGSKIASDGTGMSQNGTTKKWTTPWYFESNKAYYHFRMVNKGITVSTDGTNGDYFAISSGATASTDYHWGAPMKSDATLKYSPETGFATSVYHAIGSTHSDINILEHHMMANVEVIVRTPADNSAVELGDGTNDAKTTKVKLINFYDDAKVRMGTGLVNEYSDLKSGEANGQAFTTPTSYGPSTADGFKTLGKYSYSFVPQTLNRNVAPTDLESNCVGLVITTPDANQYYIIKRLCATNASSVSNTATSNQTVSNPITYWYPGHKYVYTITISKKGIDTITCSIVDWTTVEGNVGNIDLES